MSTTVHPDVLDSALALLSANTHTIVALAAVPTAYADTAAGERLAAASISGGDFTLEDVVGGRKLAIGSKTTTVEKSGTATAIALLDDTSERILFTAPIPDAAVTSGAVVNFLSWSITLSATA
ncbi:MAG: hypothetical protein AAF221_14055 [Pseudomonadota bacterium]